MIVGIDLGTTNSLIACVQGGEPVIIPNDRGKALTPSVVGFTENGELLVGEAARNQSISHPERTVKSIKRHMGTDHRVRLMGRAYTPQEISAMILKKLRTDAEIYTGQVVDEAVITVPAYFTDAQRQATRDAGEIAGLKVERIINEPTAASLAYGFDNQDEIGTILVYDFGGGTFDVSIIKLVEGAFKVLASAGNNRLGGDDFDQRLADYLFDQFRKTEGFDLRELPEEEGRLSVIQRVLEAAEKAKCDLSSSDEAEISLPFICNWEGSPKHMNLGLKRETFDNITRDLIEATAEPVRRAVADSQLSVDDLDAVVLVGGTTRIPSVRNMVAEMLEQEAMAGIDPDKIVAVGASIQAGVKRGMLEDLVIIDVAPYTLGIETAGDKFSQIIRRNSTIPISRMKKYVSSRDYQTDALIHVLQGEANKSSLNKTLGEFVLTGLFQDVKGGATVEVTFDYDVNGIVHVIAKDVKTGAEKAIEIRQSKDRMTRGDIEQAREELLRVAAQEKGISIEEAEEVVELSPAEEEALRYLKEAEEFMLENNAKLTPIVIDKMKKAQDELNRVLRRRQLHRLDQASDDLLMAMSDAKMMIN
jgi:molecular chaperone DnaK